MVFFQFLLENWDALQQKTYEHIFLAGGAIVCASMIAIPLGIMMRRYALLRRFLDVGSLSQTIPSLALLAFLVPFVGLGKLPTMIVLIFYALYPITRSTYVGLQNVPPECQEAAEGLGFTHFQKFWFVEFPLAFPIIMSGVRVTTASTIGITTIAAFIGAGGLGDFITQGLALNSAPLILLGAIPTAFLAIGFDYGFSQLESHLNRPKNESMPFTMVKKVSLGIVVLGLFLGLGVSFFRHIKASHSIVIASKNFTEQYILTELMAQLIESKTQLSVIRKINLGTTDIIHQALIKGEVDLYPEYTGTAYLTVLKEPWENKQIDFIGKIKKEYKEKYKLLWLGFFGFSNSQSLAVKRSFAQKNHVSSLSALSKISHRLTIAAPPEHLKREDALPGLKKAYNLNFQKVIQVDPNLLYAAIENNQADVIAVFTTDGKLKKFDLITLEDDRNFYPTYHAAPVIREEVMYKFPEINQALTHLYGFISNEQMTKLNYEVDVLGLSPAQVAHKFLLESNLL